jgi:ribosomal protein S10
MFVTISLQSKSLQSIKKFLTFLEKSCNDLNLVAFMKVKNKVTIRKGITVLKSPHVNKTAQEQFEFFVYRVQIKIFSYKYLLLLVFLKYLKSTVVFSDVLFKISLKVTNVGFQTKVIEQVNPNNFYLINYLDLKNELDFTRLFLNIPYYLLLFDIYGQLSLQKLCRHYNK